MLNFFPLVTNGNFCLPSMTTNDDAIFSLGSSQLHRKWFSENENSLPTLENDRACIYKHDFNLCLL